MKEHGQFAGDSDDSALLGLPATALTAKTVRLRKAFLKETDRKRSERSRETV